MSLIGITRYSVFMKRDTSMNEISIKDVVPAGWILGQEAWNNARKAQQTLEDGLLVRPSLIPARDNRRDMDIYPCNLSVPSQSANLSTNRDLRDC